MATTETRSQFVVQEYPYWREFLCTDSSNLDVASTSRIEAGAFLVRGLLEMKVARGQRSKLACSPSSDVSKYARDAYFHLQLSGECRARFEGTAIGLMPGDFYPVDSIRLTGSDPRPVEVLAVRLPRCALASSGFDLHQASCLLRGPRGLGAVSAGFVRALLNNPDGHSPRQPSVADVQPRQPHGGDVWSAVPKSGMVEIRTAPGDAPARGEIHRRSGR